MAERVLVAVDDSSGAGGLWDAVVLARREGAPLTVVAFAPVEPPSRCCNLQTTFWNAELRRLARETLDRARRLLPDDIDAEFIVREDRGRRALETAGTELGCDQVVDVRRRRRGGRAAALGLT